jgi:phosphoribosyl-AMP cyclohydrolase
VNQLEEGQELLLDFTKLDKVSGVIPCAVQDSATKEVILVAYVNEEALKKAVATRTAVFWSTSRSKLWEKGKESGNVFDLLEVRVNCEQNSMVYVVKPRKAGICHTFNAAGQSRDCYYRRVNFESMKLENLNP